MQQTMHAEHEIISACIQMVTGKMTLEMPFWPPSPISQPWFWRGWSSKFLAAPMASLSRKEG